MRNDNFFSGSNFKIKKIQNEMIKNATEEFESSLFFSHFFRQFFFLQENQLMEFSHFS
jgi:hypothetical protein